MKNQNLAILTTTNERYIPVVQNLLMTFQKYHPEVEVFLSCVNVSKRGTEYLLSLHNNLKIIEHKQLFETPEQEKNYCAHDRVYLMPILMNKFQKSIFWLDADVYIKDSIDEFFTWLDDYDFSIRTKEMNPYRCNCGMVWAKYSDKNLKILNEWKAEAEKLDILNFWYADQHSLNKVMHNHINVLNDIKYSTFPNKFNGLNGNDESVVVHLKGPEKLKRLK
jgi:hypothetical protein